MKRKKLIIIFVSVIVTYLIAYYSTAIYLKYHPTEMNPNSVQKLKP